MTWVVVNLGLKLQPGIVAQDNVAYSGVFEVWTESWQGLNWSGMARELLAADDKGVVNS